MRPPTMGLPCHRPLPAPPWRHTGTRVGYTHPHPSPLTGPPAWACARTPASLAHVLNAMGTHIVTHIHTVVMIIVLTHRHTSLNVIDRRHIAPDAATIEGPTEGVPLTDVPRFTVVPRAGGNLRARMQVKILPQLQNFTPYKGTPRVK